MARLFVAVWPPENVRASLAALDRPSLPGLRWTSPAQWHVTLRFLGEVADVELVRAALAGISAPPAIAVLGPVGIFGQLVLHVPVAGLGSLAAEVDRATHDFGRPPEDRRFAGHLTLARAVKGGNVDLRLFTGAAFAGAWTVEQVDLVESRLSPKGAQYAVVDTVKLKG